MRHGRRHGKGTRADDWDEELDYGWEVDERRRTGIEQIDVAAHHGGVTAAHSRAANSPWPTIFLSAVLIPHTPIACERTP